MERGPVTPTPRTTQILTYEVDGEIVVYDQAQKRAHRLNPGAARVWRLLDGKRSAAAIASDLGVDASVVDLALDDLATARLLESRQPLSVSRRSALRRVAVAAAVGFVLPAVTSMAAPLPAQAQSGQWITDFEWHRKRRRH